jgi:hypothetical protein
MCLVTGSAESPTSDEGTGTTSDFSDRLVTYLAERDRQRHESAQRMVEALTPRERELVREASSMGYALGLRAGRSGEDFLPPKPVLVGRVLDACRTFPDWYSTLAELAHAGSSHRSSSTP